MTLEQTMILRDTWRMANEDGDLIFSINFELCKVSPTIYHAFSVSDLMVGKFSQLIDNILDRLPDLIQVKKSLEKLQENFRHVWLTPQDAYLTIDVILSILSRKLGPGYTNEVRVCWDAILTYIGVYIVNSREEKKRDMKNYILKLVKR